MGEGQSEKERERERERKSDREKGEVCWDFSAQQMLFEGHVILL